MSEPVKKLEQRENGEIEPSFKMTELGPLPEEWDVVPLKTVVGFSHKPNGLVPDKDALIPFIPMALISEDSLYVSGLDLRKPSEIKSGVYFQDGDILFAKITPCLENGKQGIAKGVPGGWGYATTEVFPLHTLNIDAEFLALYLKQPGVRQTLADKMEGTTGRQRLPKSVIESLLIPSPPVYAQQGIAHVLNAIQRGIEETGKVVNAARELKKSLMRHLFTYGPIPYDQVDNVSLKETEIGPVPEHWPVSQIGDISTLQRGKDLPKDQRTYGFYPVVGSSGIVGYHNSCVANGPGVLVGRSGSVGKVTFVEGDYWPLNTTLWVKDFHSNDPRFIYYFLSHIDFSKYTAGVSVPTLNRNLVHPVKVGIPPLAKQSEIAHILQTVDRKVEAEENRKRALEVLFKALLHYLMTGKIRAKDIKDIIEV